MIRIAVEADVPQILAIYAPYILTTAYSFEYDVPSEEAFLERFRKYTGQYPWLVWEEDGEILGYAYASAPYERAAYAWCAEPSVYVKSSAHRRGIASALYRALEKILKYQGYQVLYALVTEENTGSRRFHEAVGYNFSVLFPRCGYKLGRWHGLIWMEKRLNSVEFPSSRPLAWSVIVADVQKMEDILDIFSLS